MEMNLSAFLLALAMVESGNEPKAVGRAGEVSAYQITPSMWKKYTKMPIENAGKNPHLDAVVAKKIIHDIRMSLPEHLSNDPFWIAVQWNGGPGAVKDAEGRSAFVKRSVRDFADRVRALYYECEKDPRCVKAEAMFEDSRDRQDRKLKHYFRNNPIHNRIALAEESGGHP